MCASFLNEWLDDGLGLHLRAFGHDDWPNDPVLAHRRIAVLPIPAAESNVLFRAYHPARRAAVVAPARMAAFSPSTVRAPSQRRPPPAASKPRARARPRRRWRMVRMGGRIARNGPSSYWECL